ncbi:hypothetical protein D3C71_785430 [compost metagenome]
MCEAVLVVRQQQEGAAGRHGPGRARQYRRQFLLRQVQIGQQHQVMVGGAEGIVAQVGQHEIDVRLELARARQLPALVESRRGVVDGPHLPALLRQPDRVAPGAAGQVERAASCEACHFGGQHGAGVGRRGGIVASVAPVPVGAVHRPQRHVCERKTGARDGAGARSKNGLHVVVDRSGDASIVAPRRVRRKACGAQCIHASGAMDPINHAKVRNYVDT